MKNAEMKTDKRTGRKALLKGTFKTASILFVLDAKGKKIPCTNWQGKPSFKTKICLTSNLR